ncbi:hypothetical protein ACS47_28820 [Bacillus cereus]|uniref:Uncharacterized protein n=2 Tax=Hubeivirus PfEFR4 TaxID=2843780 RepID=A0A1B1P7Q2_9CAUD|nr:MULTISPECIES: hypothetical protein [Bacillus]YP_009285245.1 hypothetical protein BI093_gp01 [Bacillus phage PfEFR-5]YP_009830730.1 hypothetical protein HWA96_gp01 [Bacillus phage PfEFR-4]EJR01503.1 hypothetical protein II7_05853 [Bacillus cereus MSX-A12]KXI84477.1 hypothetical protein ACS47_28820 [Bacillus cereus]HDR7337472.1 hypothetical protein [Bacillus anthracis]ANT40142.1 hypothetical protein [Bacillus phage PfEFR-4]ANT40370.1 hypothetical protein [Bacillus phage PfEFR-5]
MSEQKSALSVKVEVDTKEAKENVKELTAAVNECVEAFEKLGSVMGRFTNEINPLFIEVPVVLNGKTIAQKVSELIEIKERF